MSLNDEILQGRLPRPQWSVTSSGDAHRLVWRATARLPGVSGEYTGEGDTKSEARRQAASSLLQEVSPGAALPLKSCAGRALAEGLLQVMEAGNETAWTQPKQAQDLVQALRAALCRTCG